MMMKAIAVMNDGNGLDDVTVNGDLTNIRHLIGET